MFQAVEELPTADGTPSAAAAFQFAEGQCVTHKTQSMPSLVMAQMRSSNGNEFYGVRSFKWNDQQRDRLMLGDSLRAVVPGGSDCGDCMLRESGLCPMVECGKPA